MKKHFLLPLSLLVLCLLSSSSFGLSAAQTDYERSIEAVVRNKHFYKSGRFEVDGLAGVMPYDSIVNHYMIGGRLAWHLSDHYGWEIADIQAAFPSVTGFTTDLVSSKGLANLQTTKIKLLAGTNFLLSPIYGKIRFFGAQVLYFDIYVVVGGGIASTDVTQVSTTASGAPATLTSLKTGADPMFDFGFGIKIFANNALGILIDMRDYVVSSQTYGNRSLKSNFSVFGGIAFFFPTFG